MARRGEIVKRIGQEHRQELANLIKKASYGNAFWQIWDDLMYFGAAMFSQKVQWVQAREDEYLRRFNSYGKETQDLFPLMIGETVLAYKQEGFTDVLGAIYMELNLSNHWKGQFFTPDSLCRMNAKMVFGNAAEEINSQGYFTVSDPCCGSGAMLIAYAGECQSRGVEYSNGILFVAQDVDPVVARMCYVSMSLLGMAGCVIIGNSLLMDKENFDYWFTPAYFLSGFNLRKQNNPEEARLVNTIIPEEERINHA